MAIREGRWDCPSCGSVGQLGRHVYCVACGAPRPDQIRFYLPENEEAVTDAGQLAQANAGPDWICEHCGGSARATERECPGCGAPRGESAARKVIDYDLAAVPRSGEAGGGSPPPPPSTPRPLAAAGGPRGSKFGRNVLVVMLLAVLGMFGWANRTRQVEGEVAAKHWERAVSVEAYRTVTEEDWNLPAGARRVSSHRAIREYRRVLDRYETRTRQVSERVQTGTRTYTCGQIDRGNGYFEDRTCTEPEYETRYHTETYQEPIYRQEPVWDTKYVYRIKRWVPKTTLNERGDTTTPVWPRATVSDTVREGGRTERYVLTFTAPRDKRYEAEVTLPHFTRYRVGDDVPLLVKNDVARIDTAAAN